ncbi:DUF1223 domain-containing protein [Pseudomonas benzenivorans]|uniref:DUF1223 domain-containing protein n=1 Tax=Pseudomonas benzenivorans TaxID=556533 RepID=A0ABY5H962_9PSED|nr:DUF1223 domain-containing protein [Pseudomonas benzenivorans]UTW07939.1 DUF1223 domain-containing protein [Pseudomonas benzenivorans]
MHPLAQVIAALLLLLYSLLSQAGDRINISSGPSPTPVLELFTSQGCSSCPPADRWLSGLREHPQLWHGLIPLAFHVDYWDRLGWPDPFANPSHSARQRGYARRGASGAVYTPGFILAGREWRGWFRGLPLSLPKSTEVGSLTLQLDGDRLTLTFLPSTTAPTDLTAHVARLGFGLHTEVAHGENAGRELRHDFVVLSLQQIAPSKRHHWQTRLLPDTRGERQAIVVWLSAPGQLAPYQAVGGWLPASAPSESNSQRR